MLKASSNISKTYHADPEARIHGEKYYIYATKSRAYFQQKNIDLYVSEDGKIWKEQKDIVDMSTFPYVKKAVWAPSVIEKDGKYYLVFACNDIQNNNEDGGLEIAVSDCPEGPFKNHIGTHLISEFINGAQPIDAHFFKDDNGKIYLFYGGWGHCNICLMNDDMKGFSNIKEITPSGYTEAPCMFKKDGKYYFMYSSGNWTNSTYKVIYGISSYPFEKVIPRGEILSGDENIANGPGHNGYIRDKDGKYYCVYHRRPLGKHNKHARILAIDEMRFNENGDILPIKMT